MLLGLSQLPQEPVLSVEVSQPALLVEFLNGDALLYDLDLGVSLDPLVREILRRLRSLNEYVRDHRRRNLQRSPLPHSLSMCFLPQAE